MGIHLLVIIILILSTCTSIGVSDVHWYSLPPSLCLALIDIHVTYIISSD